MDADRLMFNLFQQMQAYGTDPLLADILTEDNIMHSKVLKDCIEHLTDIDGLDDIQLLDPDLIMAEKWTVDFIRGMGLGILIALETDNTNPVDFKYELSDLYKMLESLRIEKTFDKFG